MDTLIDRLQQQADGLDPTGLDPTSALPGVVRRGRRYLAVATTVGALGATAAVAVAAVAVPQVVEQLRGPTQPTVLATPDGGDEARPTDGPTAEEAAAAPIVEDAPQTVEPADQVPAVSDGPVDVAAPDVVVLEPADGATVTSDKVTFSGMTEPGATVVVGDYAATVADDGSFSILLIAAKGPNTVTFEASDAAGNTASTAVTITYSPVQGQVDTSPTDKGAADGTLTATQQASVLQTPHTNRYSGTAAPGAKVAVVSQYGTAYAWADDSGAWVAEVDFTPPAGETTFPVSVKLHHQPTVARTFQVTTHADGASGVFTASQQSSTLDGAPHKGVYRGTADPGTKVKVLSDHGWAYAWADEAGNWELVVDFDPPGGTTTFPVTARYYHDASVATTFQLTTIAAEAAAFTATQRSGSVSAADPTNVYSGSGEPGHEVWIWTEAHGQVTTAVGADGSWQVPITYAEATAGDTFPVKAKDLTTGAKHVFEVTVTG